MQSVSSHRVNIGRRMAGLLAIPLSAVLASACGSGGHPRSAAAAGPPIVGSDTTLTQPAGGSNQGALRGATSPQSVSMTVPSGYVYQARLASAGVVAMTSFTSDDGSGDGGSPVDVPPGSKLLVAQIVFSNTSDRPEPLIDAPIGVLPADGSGSGIALAVPMADASVFGIDTSGSTDVCNTGSAQTPSYVAPAGYCGLPMQIGAFSPAQSDITQPPQLASGASGTVTFISAPRITGNWVPQDAPVSDVKVFAAPNARCNCWSALS